MSRWPSERVGPLLRNAPTATRAPAPERTTMKPTLRLVDRDTTPPTDAHELLVRALQRMGLRPLLQIALDAATLAGEHGDATVDQCLTAHAAADLLRDALEACGPRRVG